MCCQGSIISKEHITHKYIFYFGLGEEASHPEELTIDAGMDWVHIAYVAGVKTGRERGNLGARERVVSRLNSLPLPTRTPATQARVHTVGGRFKGMRQEEEKKIPKSVGAKTQPFFTPLFIHGSLMLSW